MKEIKAIIQPYKLDDVLRALRSIPGLPGMTISESRAAILNPDGTTLEVRKNKLEIMVGDDVADAVVEAIQSAAHTGHKGDGRIFVIPVERSVSIRTGEETQRP